MHATKRNPLSARPNPKACSDTERMQPQAREVVRNCQQNLSPTVSELCFIRLSEVLTICGKSRTSVYESIKKGNFPAPIKLGGRSSAWVKSEVLQWAQDCVDISRMK